MSQVILASQSKQRQTMLQSLGVEFEIMPADLDEKAVTDTDQVKRSLKIAKAKAEAIISQNPSAIVLAADTFVVMPDGTPLEKPESKQEAIAMLRQQSGQTMIEVTGAYYYDGEHGWSEGTTTECKVTFRDLSDDEIMAFVEQEPVLEWSGAFCPAYPTSAALISYLDGSFTGFTHGFPVEFFVPLLRKSKGL